MKAQQAHWPRIKHPDPNTPGSVVSLHAAKAAELIADQIRGQIIRDQLKEGDYLPSEGQMIALFGVSRPTLREALRILETERLISLVRGSRSGARISKPEVAGVSRYAGFVLQAEGTTIADIYEARLAIEPYAARSLAENGPPDATARLSREADRLTGLVEAGRYIDFMIALTDFHLLLVEASGNQTLALLTKLVQNVLARYQVNFFKNQHLDLDEQRRRALWGIRSFRKLIALIEAGDGAGAEAHWQIHLSKANDTWVPAGQRAEIIDLLGESPLTSTSVTASELVRR